MQLVMRTNTATPLLSRLLAASSTQRQGGILAAWGIRIRDEARANARAKGGRRFWRDVARQVEVKRAGLGTVQVLARHVASRQKQLGGVIRAKGKASGGADALTIPWGPHLRGKRAADFSAAGHGLFVPKGSHVLGYSQRGTDGAEIGFTPLFVLVRATRRQDAEPWWPAPERMASAGEQLAAHHLGLNNPT